MHYDPEIFKIQTNNILPRKGRILLAEPFLPGTVFNRSVVLLVAHSRKGSVGFILNKQIEFTVRDYIPDFPDFAAEVYIGGPVSTDNLYFIHTLGDLIPGSIKVLDDIYWGGDFDVLKQKINLGLIDPGQVRFFVGYSGWDAGQLEIELKENSWLVNDIESHEVMHRLKMSSWKDFVVRLGKRYSLWANFPENPALN